MALSLSTTRRLREHHDLEALVRAVAGAPEDEPETDAVEWKGTLDLSARKSRFDLARHVLGFGNRAVDRARESFDGYAYVLVGVTAGKLVGIEMPDPAVVSNALSSFVAQGHPSWHLHRLCIDGTTVAVIEVAAPRAGDRICTLQSTYEHARAGRVFVRRTGQTGEATADEVRMLEDRFAAEAVAVARQANELHQRHTAATEQHLAVEHARDAREREDRAERAAPNFVSSRVAQGFSHVPPQTVQGMLRNAGGSAATIVDLRIHLPGAAVPGAGVPVYGQGPSGDFGVPVRVEPGGEVMLRFVHAAAESLAHHDGPLTVEMIFANDLEMQWMQKVTLRRKGADHIGHSLWTVRESETETSRLS